jgi:streptomycin 6-kinase
MYTPVIPQALAASARRYGQEDWLRRLPDLILELAGRWSVELGPPFESRPGFSWVAPAGQVEGIPVVLKVGMPSREARTEAAGLRFFAGRGAVRLLASDDDAFALLEERCEPGDELWTLEVEHGNEVAADLLLHLWRPAGDVEDVELLSEVARDWIAGFSDGPDAYSGDLVALAADQAAELASSQPQMVVLHGDLHPGNVLRSQRGWLSIDCKPLVGEPAFDIATLLANRLGLNHDPEGPPFRPSLTLEEIARQVDFFAETLHLDRHRVLGWAVVKAVAWDWGPATASVFVDLLDFRART